MVDGRAGGEIGVAAVKLRLVGDDGDALDALGAYLGGDARHVERAVHRLAAGHGDGVVVKNFVGHADARGDRGADGEQAGMEVGAVADVGEDVRRGGKGCLADPGGALAAHVAEGGGRAVHPDRHVMAADAGERARALRHAGRGVVRTAGAEVGDALRDIRALGPALLDPVETRDPPGDRVRAAEAGQTRGERAGDRLRPDLARRQKQPLALFVALAGDAGRVYAEAVEMILDLRLDQRALLFDDDDLFQPKREAADRVAVERPGEDELEALGLEFGDHGLQAVVGAAVVVVADDHGRAALAGYPTPRGRSRWPARRPPPPES